MLALAIVLALAKRNAVAFKQGNCSLHKRGSELGVEITIAHQELVRAEDFRIKALMLELGLRSYALLRCCAEYFPW